MAIISISLKSHDNYLYFTNIQVIIWGLHSRSGELCKRTFLLHLGSCQHFATLLFSLFPLLYGESLLKNVLKDHSCCPSQEKIKSKSYLNTSSNSMALFQATYCCIFTSRNLLSCCKGLKSYCISKSFAPLGSKMSTT